MTVKNSPARLAKHTAVLRVIFGIMWAINASFKWRVAFRDGFLDQIKSAAEGQPSWLHGWFNFWVQLLGHNPHIYALLVTVLETLIALALILGIARRTTYLAATIFSLFIWAIPEGFGGPYSATSTDIGTGIIYAIVFLSLYGLDRIAAIAKWSLDNYLIKRIAWWGFLANP